MSAHHTTAFFWNLAWALAALVVAAGYGWLISANTPAAVIATLLAGVACFFWAIVRGGRDE